MSKKFLSVQGMTDILPEDMPLWHQFESKWRNLVSAYAYEEIRFPILEYTNLFKRTIGEVTDIVEKEMFTLRTQDDKESLSLRPEGTAGCVRAMVEHSLFRHHPRHRFWYMGPMFRHEKPQMGRYRQFTHAGIEAFHMPGPDIDAELIMMTARLWRSLSVESSLILQINSLGSKESRLAYRSVLVDYLSKYNNDLDEDSQRRLKTNPLRILDSKNPKMADIINNAPKGYDYLDSDSKQHFEEFQSRLNDANIAFQLNPHLVRGLDYYNRTVFEWVTDKLGAQGTVCAGGRYDGLVEELGGGSVPAVGFAVGIERVLLLQKSLGHTEDFACDAYFIHMGGDFEKLALQFAEKWRDEYPEFRLLVHCGSGHFKKQFEKAHKSGAKIALILGETEWNSKTIGVKFLREDKPQLTIPQAEINRFLTDYLGELS